MRTLYVWGKSKAEVNRRLADANYVVAFHEIGVNSDRWFSAESLEDKDVIKIYEHLAGGNPFVKSYGQWSKKLKRIK